MSRRVSVILLAIALALNCITTTYGAIPVPTHGMIAYMGTFSDASVVEMLSNERFYNVVQFAIQVGLPAIYGCRTLQT